MSKKTTDSKFQKIADLEERAEALYYDEKYEEAIALYRKAAELGGNYSQYSLGYCYKNGQGVEENLDEAKKWLQIAGENGSGQALFDLAECLFNEGDYLDSYQWFDKAKEAGLDDSWYYLGWLYFTGEGLESNDQKAKDCWSNVIGEDQADFQYDIGNIYYLNKRYEEAVFWFKLAAKHGHSQAREWSIPDALLLEVDNVEVDCKFAASFWDALRTEIDGKSGVFFDPAQDYGQLSVRSNEYLIEGNYYKFTLIDSETLNVCLTVNTSNHEMNESLLDAFFEYLSSESDIQAEKRGIAEAGNCLIFDIDDLNTSDLEGCKESAEHVRSVISSIEYGFSDIENVFELPWAIYKIEPVGQKMITMVDNWDYKVRHIVGFRCGFIIVKAHGGLRDDIIEHFSESVAETNFSDNFEIIDFDISDSYYDDWIVMDTNDKNITKLVRADDIENALETKGFNIIESEIHIAGELEISFLGFSNIEASPPVVHDKESQIIYPPLGHAEQELISTEDLQLQGAYYEFWTALKPHLEKLNFDGFAKVKIKDSEWLNCSKGVLPGVYHSIGIIKTKHILKLDFYIDTGNADRNLKIIDYVSENARLTEDLYQRIFFDRKEGRGAQCISLSIEGFELKDKNSWNNVINELMSLADSFVTSIDKCLVNFVYK